MEGVRKSGVVLGASLLASGYVSAMDGRAESTADIAALFPQSADEVTERVTLAKEVSSQRIARLLAVQPEERTFANTLSVLDDAREDISSLSLLLEYVFFARPSSELAEAANSGKSDLDAFCRDAVLGVEVYEAVQGYASSSLASDDLDDEQRYHIESLLKEFAISWVSIKDETGQDRGQLLARDIAELEVQFLKNIALDTPSILVDEAELAGVATSLVCKLSRQDGMVVVTCDQPTYVPIITSCMNASVRRRLHGAYLGRAATSNKQVLALLRSKRHELAALLGFQSWAHAATSTQVAGTPERVADFLAHVAEYARPAAHTEMADLVSDLPEGVE